MMMICVYLREEDPAGDVVAVYMTFKVGRRGINSKER